MFISLEREGKEGDYMIKYMNEKKDFSRLDNSERREIEDLEINLDKIRVELNEALSAYEHGRVGEFLTCLGYLSRDSARTYKYAKDARDIITKMTKE